MLIKKRTLSYEYGTMMHTSILISLKRKLIAIPSFLRPDCVYLPIANKYNVFFSSFYYNYPV